MTGWLDAIQSGLSGGTGLQYPGYAYDLVGNVTQRQQDTLGLTESFHYDNLCRLDCSQPGSTTNQDLTYDAMSNIISRKERIARRKANGTPTASREVRQCWVQGTCQWSDPILWTSRTGAKRGRDGWQAIGP